MRDLTLITFVRTRKAGEEPVCDAVIFDGRVVSHSSSIDGVSMLARELPAPVLGDSF